MASYKGYTSAWINRHQRWEIFDANHQVVYRGKPNGHEDPLRDWVDNWAPEVTSTKSPTPAPTPQNIPTGFATKPPAPTAKSPTPQNIPTGFAPGPDVGEFSDVDLDDIGRVFSNRIRGFFSTAADTVKGFFKKGKALTDEDERASRRTSTLPPGEYIPADALDDFTLDTFGYGEKYKPKPADSAARKLGPEKIHLARYNPNKYNYGPVLNLLDLETVGTDTTKGSILSYAAMKVAKNLDTNSWDLVSKRTRYYYPTKEDKLLKDERGVPVYDASIAVSGLTDENIKTRRDAQAAKYGKHFNEKALKGLLNYLGKDPIVGQNISQFDWPKLFGAYIPAGGQLPNNALPPGGLIDILHLAEGTRGNAPGLNNLSTLFTLAYGQTPEQAGFTAHDALEDIQITLKVFDAMLRDDSRMGDISRYLLRHKGLSTQFRDTMIKGITEIRGMTPEQQDIVNHLTDFGEHEPLIEDIARTSFSGGSTSRTGSLQALGVDASGLTSQLQELASAVSRLTATMEGQSKTGLASTQIVREAAGLKTVNERKEYLHNVLGLTGDYTASEWGDTKTAAGYALNRANAIYKARHGGLLEDLEGGSAQLAGVRPRSEWDMRLDKIDTTGGPAKPEKLALFQAAAGRGMSSLGGAIGTLVNGFTALAKIVGAVTDAYDAYYDAQKKGRKEIYGAASYFIPGPLKEAGNRFFNAYQMYEEYDHLRKSKWGHLIGDLGGALDSGTASGGMGGIVRGVGGFMMRRNLQEAADKTSRIDLWAGFTELMLAPLKLAASGLKNLWGISLKLGKEFLKIIANMRNLGIPLTHLTGVTYADMQRSYAGDAMIGAGNGTMNNAYNQFAGAQQDLFTLGQMDTTRVIAAAMTGTFGSVYANGGDTQEQYAATANKIAAQINATKDPRERQKLMNLASKIDSTLPTTIQQMTNLGITDYRSIQNGAWLKGTGITQYTSTDRQRAAYTRVGMEYTALSESIGDTKNVIATKLWNFLGRDVMSAVNDVFRILSEGRWEDAIELAKTKAKQFWGKISTAIFGKEISLGDVWEKVKGKVADGFVDVILWALPKITPFIEKYIQLVCAGWKKIFLYVGDVIDKIVERLKWTKLGFYTDDDGQTKFGITTLRPWEGDSSKLTLSEAFSDADGSENISDKWRQMVLPYKGAPGHMGHAASLAELWRRYIDEDNTRTMDSPLPDSWKFGWETGEGDVRYAKNFREVEAYLRARVGMRKYGIKDMQDEDYAQALHKNMGDPMSHGFMYGLISQMGVQGLDVMEGEVLDMIKGVTTKDIPRMAQEYKDSHATLDISVNGENKGSISIGSDGSIETTGQVKKNANILSTYIGVGTNGQVVNLGTAGGQ